MKVEAVLAVKGREVATVHPAATLATVAQRLRLENIGALVVLEGEHLAGMISERDVVHAFAAHRAEASEIKVDDVMSRHVITCRPEDSLTRVLGLMTRHRVRHLPVLEGGRLVRPDQHRRCGEAPARRAGARGRRPARRLHRGPLNALCHRAPKSRGGHAAGRGACEGQGWRPRLRHRRAFGKLHADQDRGRAAARDANDALRAPLRRVVTRWSEARAGRTTPRRAPGCPAACPAPRAPLRSARCRSGGRGPAGTALRTRVSPCAPRDRRR